MLFHNEKGVILEHIVSSYGMEIDKVKVKSIPNIPIFQTVMDICSLSGHAGFY